MYNLYFDHAFRLMSEADFKQFAQLGFVLAERVAQHEGCLTRFLYFKMNFNNPELRPYQYLEFVDINDPNLFKSEEGLSFFTPRFDIFEKGVKEFKVFHKNLDWYNDEKDPSRRAGWNFAVPLEGSENEPFIHWVTHYELKHSDNEFDHPNSCQNIEAILFRDNETLKMFSEIYKLDLKNDKIEVGGGNTFEVYNPQYLKKSSSVISAIVIKCKSLETVKSFAKERFIPTTYKGSEAGFIALDNLGFDLIII